MHACMCMCVFAPKAINNWWHDINPIWLVKRIQQPLYGNCSQLSVSIVGMAFESKCIIEKTNLTSSSYTSKELNNTAILSFQNIVLSLYITM